MAEVHAMMEHLLSLPKVKNATHNILAYRQGIKSSPQQTACGLESLILTRKHLYKTATMTAKQQLVVVFYICYR